MNKFYDIGTSDILGSRGNQEDSYIVTDPGASNEAFDTLDHLLVVLADGVGGEAAGEVASKTVTNCFSRTIQSAYSSSNNIPKLLNNALHGANQAVARAISENSDYEGMASTLVGALLIRDRLYWVSVGDSHLYLIRDGSCIKLNADHSLGAIMDRNVDTGLVSKSQAVNAPNRNMLYSCVMGEELAAIDLPKKEFSLQKGDRLLFSSDGLDSISSRDISRISANDGSAQHFAVALTAAVEKADKPNQDNTMVVVVDIVGGNKSQNDEKTVPTAKKSRKTLIMTIILFIILAIFALYYFQQPAPHKQSESNAETPIPKNNEKDDKLKLKSIPGS
ncbi:MAG TPA: serine/threonine-protein phosphatase [Acidiferrobacteraceae bacterium]|nr:serine/threonine-protein phosphatase [Acidiferrobacteraceae bacterium]HEX20429.1 serine/threonine-protein phosphatase [Acidiferrobacteraceae bacterium]